MIRPSMAAAIAALLVACSGDDCEDPCEDRLVVKLGVAPEGALARVELRWDFGEASCEVGADGAVPCGVATVTRTGSLLRVEIADAPSELTIVQKDAEGGVLVTTTLRPDYEVPETSDGCETGCRQAEEVALP